MIIRCKRRFRIHSPNIIRWMRALTFLTSPVLLCQAAIAESPVLDETEQRLLKILSGEVEVTASKAKIDRQTLLDRMLTAGDATYTRYQDDERRNLRITTHPAKRTLPVWPKSDGDPMTVGVPGESTSWIIRSRDHVVMPAQLDLTQSVSVTYAPPEVRLFAGSDPRPVDMTVKVYDIQGTGGPEHTGTLRVNARDRGVRRIKTPAGTFDVVMFRNDYKGDIGPASVDDTSLIFVSPTHGMIATIEHKKVSAMIFYNKDTRVGYALASSDDSKP